MAAAMASTTVETASAMEPATTAVKAFATAEATAIAATVPTAAITITAVTIVAAVAVISAAIVAAATVEAAAVIAAVIPGASADEDAAEEVVRAIVAVRSAGIRIVAVVTIGADWRWANGAVHGAYSNAHPDLGVGTARGKEQNS